MVGKYTGAIEVPPGRGSWRRSRVAEQAELLGGLNDPATIGARSELHGRRLADLPHYPGIDSVQLVAAFA